MPLTIALLDTVAVREDLPDLGLSAGEVGAVVEVLSADAFEVEFVDRAGQPYALHTLGRAQLMPLMNTKTKPWFSLSAEGGTILRCAECGQSFDLKAPRLDHHPAVCPICGVECVYLDSKSRIIQVVLKNAHPALAAAIRILQDRFDELEYVELVVALEELADALYRPVS